MSSTFRTPNQIDRDEIVLPQSTCQTLANNPRDIARAAELIKDGELVAFPTETVYGLGGDATNDHAVAAIFKAKGRPQFNPLIVHFADVAEVAEEVDFDARARALADAFWPGPLTLILPRQTGCRISLLASAGLETLAVRIPGHDLARSLIETAQKPIAAPSANRSGHTSPTCAEHVITEFGAGLSTGVAAVIDGGNCSIGIESTVLDLSIDMPIILRPGKITAEQLEPLLGSLGQSAPESSQPNSPVKSPGLLERHYAPDLPLRMNAREAKPREALLGFGPNASEPAPVPVLNLSLAGNLDEAAANLFSMIRALDRGNYQGIAVMPIPDKGLGCAINDRLRRASHD